jgi:uncharacterized protein (DUF885 family)
MKNRLLLLVLLVAGLGALRAAPAASFPAMLERYYQDTVVLNPLNAAGWGDGEAGHEDVFPNDIGPDYRAQARALVDKYLGELATFDRAALSPTERLSYDTLKWTLQAQADYDAQFFHLTPVNQFWSTPNSFAQLGSGKSVHPFQTEKNFRDFISRMHGFSTWVDTAIANMKEGVARGIVQPKILMERVLPQLESSMQDDPAKNIFFGPLAKLPAGLAPAAREKLTADYTAAIHDVVIPAYQRLHAYIKHDYLPHCRDTAGLGALPGGAKAYAAAVRLYTTTDFTPDEIHEIGLKEVARVKGEMAKVQAQVGFQGTLPEFLNYAATDPKFSPFTADEQVLDGFRAIESRVMAKIPQFFGHVPRTKFEVRATEKFRAASAAHEYQPGTADGSRPGVFYAPIPDVTKYRVLRMEDLFLHEAIPGHHFQLSLTIENTGLPKFRRYGGNNAYIEGWALYTESLGKELGLFSDPYQYLGMLIGDMHRAVRLVVDTGIHAKGWTREQAMAYAAEQEGGSPTEQKNVAETERYMAIPGQALSYKLGQLKIREVRARSEKQLGAKFSLPAFHDCVLMEGALPLAVLDAHVQDWATSLK